MASFSLQGDFATTSQQDWLAEVERVLRGKSPDKLNTRRLDGIVVAPLYDGQAAHPAGPLFSRSAPWRIVQRMDDPEPARANSQALADLEGGADALALVFRGAGAARSAGLASDKDALAKALSGVHADMLHIRVEGSAGDLAAVQTVLGAGSFDLGWCVDPLAMLAALPAGVELIADGRVWHEAGATDAQELGYALSQALALVKAREQAGMEPAEAAARAGFLLAADTDIMGTIAKFRAIRLLWARLLEAAGLPPAAARVHGETAWRMMAARDVHTNMLRTGAAALAAALGGADTLTVLPFTAALGLPDAFARRVARNSQIMLIEESSLARVSDPAAGAGAAEALTRELAASAWAVFQATERAGGLAAAFENGRVQQSIAERAGALGDIIATRRSGLTGVSEFPDLEEAPTGTLPFEPVPAAAPAALPRKRLSEPFEKLRAEADALRADGRAPRIFMANLAKGYGARATWAGNLFAAGGIKAEGSTGFDTPEAVAEAFTASGARLACICGDDDAYAAMAPDAVAALKAAGAAKVALAGRPAAETGADVLVHIGCDVVTVLQGLLGAEEARS